MSLARKIAALFGAAGGPSLDPAIVPRLGGSVVQEVGSQTGALSSSVTVMPLDDTIPQITEGTELLTTTITPTNSANYLVIEAVLNLANNTGVTNMAALFQDATANALAGAGFAGPSNAITQVKIKHRMLAGTTSATTFRVRVGPATAVTMTVNGVAGGRMLGGVMISSMTVTEVKV